MEIIFFIAFVILLFLIIRFCGIILVHIPGVVRSVNDSIKSYWPTVILIGLTLFFIFIGFPILRNQRIDQWIENNCKPYDVPQRFYAVAIARNNADAMYALAECYHWGVTKKDIKQSLKNAIYWYRKAAEQGHVGAKQRLQELGE